MTLYAKLNEDFSENYLGYSALALILSTCVGSAAVMTALMNGHGALEMTLVFLAVAVCSAHNASIISVQKPDLVLKLLITSLVVNTLIIVFSLMV